ncbi:MAG TPA: putative protein N(5)-glutamine methyltransferase [Naasia sp.]|jgi:release factor glutamine methyltransferase
MTGLVERLRAAGCVFAEMEAALLTEAASGKALEQLVRRRVAGEPLEQLLGWAEFSGRRILVQPGLFVPRRRTELLVDLAGQHAAAGAVIVDLCCGTGAAGAVLLDIVPGADVHAADLDPAAVACAERNLAGRGAAWQGDLYDALPAGLRGQVDILVVNAPYVPTAEIAHMPPEARDHENLLALDGGPDGLDIHRRVAAGAPAWLAPGGMLVLETSAEQAGRSAAMLSAAGLRTRIVHDEERDATAVVAIRERRAGEGAPHGPSRPSN